MNLAEHAPGLEGKPPWHAGMHAAKKASTVAETCENQRENLIFATTMGPQEAFTVAKIGNRLNSGSFARPACGSSRKNGIPIDAAALPLEAGSALT